MAKTPEEIQDIRLASQEFITSVTSVAAALKENAKLIKEDSGEATAKSIVETAKARKLAEKYKQLTVDTLAGTKSRAQILKDVGDITSIQAGLEAEILELKARHITQIKGLSKLELKRLEHLENANDTFEGFKNIAKEVEKEVEDINSQTELFDNLAELTDQIPGIGVIFKEFGKASKAAGKAAAEGGNAMAAGASQLAGAVGKLTTAFALKNIISGIKDGSQNITDLSRNLNISREAADELNDSFNRTGRSLVGLTGNDLRKATLDVSNYLGISAELSNDTAKTIGVMTQRLGISAEQASKLTAFTAGTNQELKGFTDNLIGTVMAQNAASDSAVRYQDVLKDVSNTSAATQLTTSKFPGGLAKAAYEARKVGLNMALLEKSASSLLNFESSIEAEMEAELLTGKELNLERARMAALTGDNATLAAELAKNFGTAAEFTDQNVIAQEAQAKAMGMSRQEMAETLIAQEAMGKLGMDMSKSLSANVKDRQKEIAHLREIGEVQKANNLEKELYSEIGDTELGRQQKNMSLQESQKELLEEISIAAQAIAKPFDAIGNIMQGIGTSATEFLVFTTKIGSKLKALAGYLFDAFKPVKEVPELLTKNFGKFGKFLGGSFIKAAGKGGMKALLKKIPIIGALVGLGFAAKRASEGDWLGAGAELLSGIVSIFPGIGTGASIGIDAALMAGDAAGITGEKMTANQKTSIATNVAGPGGVAGSQVMGWYVDKMVKKQEETNKLMAEIAAKDTNTYLNGTKVNQELALGANKQ